MLKALFNKVAHLQDCYKTLHALLKFYFSLSKILAFL